MELVSASANNDELKQCVDDEVKRIVSAHPDLATYAVLVVYDERMIGQFEVDRMYQALNRPSDRRRVLLVLHSPGGSVVPAYRIAALCNVHGKERFVVGVPRLAKSAATLLCCGADEIHMGLLSELGPIDIQINNRPALAIRHSVENLAQLVSEHPQSAEMLAMYMARTLPIEQLGHYERLAESVVQYAERLLRNRRVTSSAPSESIARTLVYEYKDHSFMIDANEAIQIFGSEVIHVNKKEYELSNEIYSWLSLASFVLTSIGKKLFSYSGSAGDGAWIADPTAPRA